MALQHYRYSAVEGARSVLASIWRRLLEGELVIGNFGYADGSFHVAFIPCDLSGGTPSSREVAVIDRTLRGESAKVVAADLGCSLSTISASLAHTLRRWGLSAQPRQIPAFLAVLAHAGRSGVVTDVTETPQEPFLVTIPRPRLLATEMLSPCEHQIVDFLLLGDSYADIARERATSPRTVANQLASVYAKLRVSGRQQLLARLVEQECWT